MTAPFPEVIDYRPETTLILAGDHRPTWENLLPRLHPQFIWVAAEKDEAGLAYIRWHMPALIAEYLEITSESACSAEGCGCKPILPCADGGYFVDTNLRETGFYFGIPDV